MTLQSMGRPDLATDPIGKRIAELAPWFHNLHLPSGHQTAPDHPLGDFPSFKWEQLAPVLPQDLAGWSVLDIGCNAGFYSFELAARGADVVGIDLDPHYLRQARWVAETVEVPGKVRFEQMQVYDLAHVADSFDLVLFLGVLYHLRYPLLALDILAEKARRLLVVQTLTMPGDEGAEPPDDLGIDERERMTAADWPKMAFIERSLAADPTNWWAPTESCVEAMLRSTGMKVVARPGHEMFVCEPGGPAPAARAELAAAIGRRELRPHE